MHGCSSEEEQTCDRLQSYVSTPICHTPSACPAPPGLQMPRAMWLGNFACHGTSSCNTGVPAPQVPKSAWLQARTCHILSICGSARPAAVDVGRDVVDLLAVLVCHHGACCGPRVSTKHHSTLQVTE